MVPIEAILHSADEAAIVDFNGFVFYIAVSGTAALLQFLGLEAKDDCGGLQKIER